MAAVSPLSPSVSPSLSRPWWREPMVWLVISGPLSVILACVVTAILVINHPDPVLSMEPTVIPQRPADDLQGRASQQPAMKARNHAATGGL